MTVACLSPPRTVLFSTEHKPWANVIACGYEAQHSVKDLRPFKAFLLAGTVVTIVEEKVRAGGDVMPENPGQPVTSAYAGLPPVPRSSPGLW